MTEEKDQILAAVLPPHCAEELRAAAKTVDPFERVKAIDMTADRLRATYPEFFRSENHDQGNRTQ